MVMVNDPTDQTKDSAVLTPLTSTGLPNLNLEDEVNVN